MRNLCYILLKEWVLGWAGMIQMAAARHIQFEWREEMSDLANTAFGFIVDSLLLCNLLTFGLEFFLNLIAWNGFAIVIVVCNKGDIEPKFLETTFPVYLVLFQTCKVLRKKWFINRVPEESGQSNDDVYQSNLMTAVSRNHPGMVTKLKFTLFAFSQQTEAFSLTALPKVLHWTRA